MKIQTFVVMDKFRALKTRNFHILSIMEETGVNSLKLELLRHNKCRIIGCETIHHLY